MPLQLLPQHITSYLEKRAFSGPWIINEIPSHLFFGAVVIPSLAEAENLPKTLESISLNPPNFLDQFIIIIVVNQRADASLAEKENNLRTLDELPRWKKRFGLPNLFWVDASSKGKELPPKQGVGLARKIGLDVALNFLNYKNEDPLLICLDADTTVEADYLFAITRHFVASKAGGVSISYHHSLAESEEGQAAIDRYELFLRSYVLGLKLAGSPYAFHTVGSAMGCRASAYIASGGMNRRLAGEDFYFLQQVYKTSGVDELTGTVVHPSPRSSNRVPFGTGRAVGDMLGNSKKQFLFYNPTVFTILHDWLECVISNSEADSELLFKKGGEISPLLHDFLEQAGFRASWKNLKKQNREKDKLITAFHGWFDAFRTMRLIHELSDEVYKRAEPEVCVAPLIEKAGFISPKTISEQLEFLRKLQSNQVLLS